MRRDCVANSKTALFITIYYTLDIYVHICGNIILCVCAHNYNIITVFVYLIEQMCLEIYANLIFFHYNEQKSLEEKKQQIIKYMQ